MSPRNRHAAKKATLLKAAEKPALVASVKAEKLAAACAVKPAT